MLEHSRERMEQNRLRQTITRIQMEYLEMPGLKLTTQQACRLFDLPSDLCDSALEALVGQQFLSRTRDGAFLRRAPLVRRAV